MSNLDVWRVVEKPPKEALKTIKGGRLSGMTDINPQWRYKAMTEQFGMAGEGWTYDIIRLWTEDGTDGQRMAFAQVGLRVKRGEHWSEPIPGIGGAAMIAKETGGLRSSDEAYKMAVTDALSVAMKMLGVGSAIYEGRWDGSKYADKKPDSPVTPSAPITPSTGAWDSLSPDMQAAISDVADKMIIDMDNGNLEHAIESMQQAILDLDMSSEEKVALWSLLPSHHRSAIKKAKQSP